MLLHMTGYKTLMVLSFLFSLPANVARITNLQKILTPRLLLQDDELVALQIQVHLHQQLEHRSFLSTHLHLQKQGSQVRPHSTSHLFTHVHMLLKFQALAVSMLLLCSLVMQQLHLLPIVLAHQLYHQNPHNLHLKCLQVLLCTL